MIYGPQPLPNLNGPEQSVGQNYVYDAWNRLVSVGNGSTTYQYDGLDRKVEMTNNGWSGEVTYYFYAGQQMIEEAGPLAGAEDPRSLRDAYEYVYSARGGNIPILRDLSQYSYPGGQPSVTGRFYYLTDADNNVTTLVSANGSVLERCLYDAYGTALFGGELVELRLQHDVGLWQHDSFRLHGHGPEHGPVPHGHPLVRPALGRVPHLRSGGRRREPLSLLRQQPH